MVRGERTLGLPDGPYHHANEQEDIDNLTRIERHSEDVDEQQLEPSANLYDAGNDTIEHCCEDDYRDEQGYERALQVALRIVGGEFLVIIYQHNGRQTQQVQQVDTDGDACQIHDQHQPTVGMRLVGLIFPLQDEPEHNSRKG